MLKFYKIPKSVLINNGDDLIDWLEALPKTKRGKDAFVFGKVYSSSIAFIDSKDALAFSIRFGASPITEEDRKMARLSMG